MDSPRNIAVLSDTHNYLPEKLLDRLSSADEIWHLGDVSDPEILSSIRSLDKPTFVVRGNMDVTSAWPEKLELERNGLRFALQHRPPTSIPLGVKAVLFGHLHYQVNENSEGIRLLNPGAINGPRNGSVASFAWLKITTDGQWSWDVEALPE